MGWKRTRKGGNGKRKKNIRNVLHRLNGLGLQTNSMIPFLKAAVMKMKAIIFITLATVRQN